MKIVSIVSQAKWSDSDVARFKKLGEFVEFSSKDASAKEVIEMIGDATILVVGSSGVDKISAEVMESCPNLKFITVLGVGVDFVDMVKATELGIKVSNLRGANSESVAEHLWGLLLGLSKRIVDANNGTKEGDCSFTEYFGKELQGKTIGILGYGSIGSKVARIAKGFEMEILVFDLIKKEDSAVRFVEIPELLSKSDVIAVTLPLTDQTKGFLAEKEFGQMKNGVILVSTSREALIDKGALMEALKNKKLFGFGMELDMNTSPDKAFYQFPNVILTPHNAFYTQESEDKCNEMAIENVEKFLQGNPQNLVN